MCITADQPLVYKQFMAGKQKCIASVINSSKINGSQRAFGVYNYKRLFLNVLGDHSLIRNLRTVYFATFFLSSSSNTL